MRKFSAFGAAAALGLGVLATAIPATGQTTPGPGPTVVTFGASGTWTVPADVSCATFTVVGAQGGTGGALAPVAAAVDVGNGGAGGLGGRVAATMVVSPGSAIDLGVGVRGADGDGNLADAAPTGTSYAPKAALAGGAGGSLGGGQGGEGEGAGGGGGGGASTVSLAGGVVIVAAGGGGGGAGYSAENPGEPGGNDEHAGTDGLPSEGFSAALAGGGATATAGGAAGTNTPEALDPGTEPQAGVLTDGGAGGISGDGGGGGGGGWYGGGGGGAGWASGGSGGGGGSNLVPAGASVAHGIVGSSNGDGLITVTFTPGDLSCGAPAPAAVVATPRFTG